MRLNLWSPLPPSASGIADYAAEQLPALRRAFDVRLVSAETQQRPAADLELYQIGNSAEHAFVYRAALEQPGVVLLHDWSLHHLVLGETVERGRPESYLREMRRAYGETGTFVGGQVARALGGELLPARYPLNERLLESALAVVGLTGHVASRAAASLGGRPTLRLPHHLALPIDPLPTRAEARLALGLPADALLVTAPGLATASKRLDVAIRVVARLRQRFPSLALVVAGGADPRLPLDAWSRAAGLGDGLILAGRQSLEDFVRHLVAADVVLALRFPSHGEMSGALVRALGVGRPVLVTAGTPAEDELPEGLVAPVDPGRAEAAELEALLERLLEDAGLRETLGQLARAHVLAHHDLEKTTARLAAFLVSVEARKPALLQDIDAARVPADSLEAFLLDELRLGARELGLATAPLGLEAIVKELVGGGR